MVQNTTIPDEPQSAPTPAQTVRVLNTARQKIRQIVPEFGRSRHSALLHGQVQTTRLARTERARLHSNVQSAQTNELGWGRWDRIRLGFSG